ncbi:unnamed protein product [Tetraodon nigroviridis]|uniref:(spotted green pufferfish) hypothetical protein n=1 Tax=Tetraodon nigroviridis TaxID=99883 RepID=Q4RQD1_TETNG|nr:unnamed protein product [Tetraodon nigroviridis]
MVCSLHAAVLHLHVAVKLLTRVDAASARCSVQHAHVKNAELLQEAWVGEDVSVELHSSHGLPQRQALSDHQEGQHQCGRTAHSHQTMDEYSSWDRDINFLRNKLIRYCFGITVTDLPPLASADLMYLAVG